MLLIFCSLKTKDRLHIHAQTHTHTKPSMAKSFIIQLSWKYYKVASNLIQYITLKSCSSVA